MKAKPVDKILLALVVILVVGGFLIFSSASLGLLSRSGASFSSVAFNQFLFGIAGFMFVNNNTLVIYVLLGLAVLTAPHMQIMHTMYNNIRRKENRNL